MGYSSESPIAWQSLKSKRKHDSHKELRSIFHGKIGVRLGRMTNIIYSLPILQIGATILPANRPNSNYLYEIYFVTGSRNGAGTTAHVGCEIFGEGDNSGPCYLLDSRRPLFRRGDLNVFIISVPSSLGVIRGLRVWHDNSGKNPAWFLNRVILRDCQTDEKWIFLAGKNIAINLYTTRFSIFITRF